MKAWERARRRHDILSLLVVLMPITSPLHARFWFWYGLTLEQIVPIILFECFALVFGWLYLTVDLAKQVTKQD